MAPSLRRDAPCRPALPRKRASSPRPVAATGSSSCRCSPLFTGSYLYRRSSIQFFLQEVRPRRRRYGTLQIRFLTTRIVHSFSPARQPRKRRASEFSWPFTNPGPPSCGSLPHYWNRSEARPRSGFPESFTAVVDGFTSGAGSFKFSRSVLKILKLFLEVSDDAREQGGEVIPRRGE